MTIDSHRTDPMETDAETETTTNLAQRTWPIILIKPLSKQQIASAEEKGVSEAPNIENSP